MSCQPDQESDANLCYSPCPTGFNGIGPLCWRYNCPNPKYPTSCGAGVCTDNDYDCQQYALNVAASTAESVGGAAACTYEGAACDMWLSSQEQNGATLASKTIDSISGNC